MNRIVEKILEHKFLVVSLLITALLAVGLILNTIKSRTYITAEFKDLRPFHHSVPVYYKGFKIGKAENVRPNKDFTSTVMTIVLFPNNLHLPTNIIAKFEKEKGKHREIDFIDLIYPDSPSIYFLKNGDRLAGKTTVDVETYFANQDPETLDAMRDNLAKTIENMNITIGILGDLFTTMRDTVQANQSNILITTGNMAEISENIKDSTVKLNNAIEESKLKNTVNNVDLTSNNAQLTSQNLEAMSRDVNKITKDIEKMMPQVDCIIKETYSITRNINDITDGVSCTMQKQFGGMRLLFGKTIKCKKCKRTCP